MFLCAELNAIHYVSKDQDVEAFINQTLTFL